MGYANNGNEHENDETTDEEINNEAWMDENTNDRRPPISIVVPEINVEDNSLPAPYTDAPTDTPEGIAAKMDARYGKRTNPQRLRRRKQRD